MKKDENWEPLMTDTNEIKGFLINGIVEFFPEKRLLIRKSNAQRIVLHIPASGCLMSLIENKPEVVSQSNLIMAGWGDLHQHVSLNTFYQSILGLRQSLEDLGLEKDLIMTIRRRGLFISANNTITLIPMKEKSTQPTISEFDAVPTLKKTDTNYFCQKNKFSFFVGKKGMIFISILIILTTLTLTLPLLQESKYSNGKFFSSFYKLQSFEKCNIYANNPMINYESYITFIKKNKIECDQRTWWYISADINYPRTSLVRCIHSIVESQANYCSTDYYYRKE